MQRRKGADAVRGGGDDANGAEKQSIAAAAPASTAAVELRRPRHGGWQGTEPGREAQMLRGEPGYHLGMLRQGLQWCFGGAVGVHCRLRSGCCGYLCQAPMCVRILSLNISSVCKMVLMN